MTDPMPAIRPFALAAKAWPYEEARKLLKRWPDGKPGGQAMVFETGYGPSGLPHIGTFNEVLRTTMVRQAFHALSDTPTRLIAFSDDLDGLRKVPDNVPNQAMLAGYLGRPLTSIPDPFGTHDSFAAHNNARLRAFLDDFGFDYDFVSSTEHYRSGRFDDALRGVLRHYRAILDVMLPTLGAERRLSYAPILPISPTTGVVLQVPVEVVDAAAGTIRFTDSDGQVIEQSALGGRAKLQWKVDWAMRWVALGVDYEMSGKDLIDSVTQSSKIARVLGGRPPEGFNYEMFLDDHGEKISKSKGNGLSLEQWLTYGPRESLAFYIFREPKRAKQLHAGVIPRAIDDYWQFRAGYAAQEWPQRLGNPVHHVHDGQLPAPAALPITFQLLLNLVSVLNTADAALIESYLAQFLAEPPAPPIQAELRRLIAHAIAYHRDIVAPTLVRRAPTAAERPALEDLAAALTELASAPGTIATKLQDAVYAIGKRHFGQDGLRDWFGTLYETLLGASQGPRMGSFFALYGIADSRQLITDALAR